VELRKTWPQFWPQTPQNCTTPTRTGRTSRSWKCAKNQTRFNAAVLSDTAAREYGYRNRSRPAGGGSGSLHAHSHGRRPDVHAAIVIFGGSFAATLIRFPLSSIFHGLPLDAKFAFSLRRMSQRDLVDELAGLAEVVRKSGPIGLEKVEIEDPFLAKGVRFVADGYDGNFIRDNLKRDRDNFLTHLDEGQKIYRAVGHCAPALGMIGTLIGMVQMFANMTDPSKLGPFMAVALLATFYGAAVTNLLCLPIADKLHLKLVDEEINRTLIIDGILMIREGKSPTLVREMLLAYLPEKHRHIEEEGNVDEGAEAVPA
jgi:chemotaxis protein MotA